MFSMSTILRYNKMCFTLSLYTVLVLIMLCLRIIFDVVKATTRQHCFEINSSKSKIIIVHKKRACHSDVYFEINGSKVELVKSYKYSGMIITFSLKEKEDIMRLQASFIARLE